MEHLKERFRNFWARRSDTERKILVVTTGAVVIVAIAALLNSDINRDEPSYEAGQYYGKHYADIHNVLAPTDDDAGVRTACVNQSYIASQDGAFRSGPRVAAADIDREDFQNGCYAVARALIPKGPASG